MSPPGTSPRAIPPTIRAAGAGDLDALAALEAAAFGAEAWSRRLIAEELGAPAALVLVARQTPGEPAAPIEAEPASGRPRLAAYACFRRAAFAEAVEAELLRVAVAPAARRRGLAAALLAAGLGCLRAEGAAACFLEVAAGNEPAIALYRRLGFQATGRRPRYYPSGADALLMRLDLDRAAGS